MSGITTERWFVDGDFRPGMEWNRHIMRDEGTAVCFMAHSDGRDTEGDEARAALIAAAPMLLDALKDALSVLERSDYGYVRDKVIAAIEAATGAQS